MSYSLLLPFDTDNEEFVRGFEAGHIWTLMAENPDKLIGMTFHSTNAEMVIRMIEKKGLLFKAEFTDDERWMTLNEL